MKTFVIVSGNKYRSYLFSSSWTEDLGEAEIYRDPKGAESIIRKMTKTFKDSLERFKKLAESEEDLEYTLDDFEKIKNIYQLFSEAKVVEVKIVLDEKN